MIINKVNINKNRSTLFRDLHDQLFLTTIFEFKTNFQQ